MSIVQFLKEAIPYQWKKKALDVVRPNREGIAPILRGMDRDLKTIFDIGANVGDVSRLMLLYFPKATVYSFEPCSSTYQQLVQNIARAGFGDRSHTFPHGFFDEEKEATLNIASYHGANSMLDISEDYRRLHPHITRIESEQIPLMRLDDFIARQGVGRIDLVKIDVEGVELQILKGGAQTFGSRVDVVVMEISFVRNQRESGEFIRLFQLMHEYGFAPAEIYDLAHAGGSQPWKLVQFDCVFRRY